MEYIKLFEEFIVEAKGEPLSIEVWINDNKRTIDSYTLDIKKPTLEKIKKELKKADKEVASVRSDYWIQAEFEFDGESYTYSDGELTT